MEIIQNSVFSTANSKELVTLDTENVLIQFQITKTLSTIYSISVNYIIYNVGNLQLTIDTEIQMIEYRIRQICDTCII